MALFVKKKPLKLSEKLIKKFFIRMYIYQLIKNLSHLVKIQGRKPGNLINKKSLKLDKETRKKPDYLLLYIFAL